MLSQIGELTPQQFMVDILSMKYFKPQSHGRFAIENTLFNVLHGFLDYTDQLIRINPDLMQYKSRWLKKIYHFTLKAIKHHDCKNKLPDLIKILIKNDIKPEDMEYLLIHLLDEGADYGYWDCDAVIPIFPYLGRYFSQTCLEYLQYKINQARFSIDIKDCFNENFINEVSNEYKVRRLKKRCKRKNKRTGKFSPGHSIPYTINRNSHIKSNQRNNSCEKTKTVRA